MYRKILNIIFALTHDKRELAVRYLEILESDMRKSAELSEAKEEIEWLRLAIKTHRDQFCQNKCWANDFRLHCKLGEGKPIWPDPENITPAEYIWCCLKYIPSIKESLSESEKKMFSEMEEVAKKFLF